MNKNRRSETHIRYLMTIKVGEVQIADEVVLVIAGLAAEVKGVASTSGNVTNELAGKLGKKNLSKGVKVLVSPDSVSVDMALTLEYGYGIPETAKQVQEKYDGDREYDQDFR